MVVEETTVEETLRMSGKERNWLVELRKVLEGKETLKDAQAKLGGSYRNAKRKLKRLREKGDAGLVHRSRGQPSNRAKPAQMKDLALGLYRERLTGWGPTLAAEKVQEMGCPVDHETLRRWLMEEGLWTRARTRKAHRRWREPKEHLGELVQLDGSPHDWFGTGEKCCLMNLVDDATSRSFALLFPHETTQAAMRVLMGWIERYGIPCALYTDHHTIYVTDREPTREELEKGLLPLTVFGKTCHALGIQIIPASSPQAKGRVERKHGMYQDRLVKELAWRGIQTTEEANAFLMSGYLDELNKKFEKVPSSPVDYHRAVREDQDLEAVFVFEQTRTVSNDWTVRYDNRLYQITGPSHRLPPAKSTVDVQERLDGSLHLYYRGHEVRFSPISVRPVPVTTPPLRARARTKWSPPPDHPWRGRYPDQITAKGAGQ
jgi:transposase